MVRQVIACMVAILLNANAVGQTSSGADGASRMPPEIVVASIKESAQAGVVDPKDCWIESPSKSIPSGALVVVIRHFDCKPRYGSSKSYFEVLLGRKTYHVSEDDLAIRRGTAAMARDVTASQLAERLSDWTDTAHGLNLAQKKLALEQLDKTRVHGLALLKSAIYDVSEHTEGTGFRVEVLNTSKKTIKYLSFSVIGYNPVNDPVRDRLRGSTVLTLRGVGPIEPHGSGTYTKDYMWMTDLVEDHKVTSIKVEYMDGTSRVIKDVASVRMSSEELALLLDTD